MKYFVSKNVSKEGRDLVFGNLPDINFTIIEDGWSLNDILEVCGVKISKETDKEIPKGLSQFKSNDGDFEKSIFILNF